MPHERLLFQASADFAGGGIQPGTDGFYDGCGIGKFAGLLFGIDFFAVNGHFEDAAAHRNECERTDILLQPQQLFRQTDGVRFIISHAAVLDFDFQSHNARNVEAIENRVKWSSSARQCPANASPVGRRSMVGSAG